MSQQLADEDKQAKPSFSAEASHVCHLTYSLDGQKHTFGVGTSPVVIGRARDCALRLRHESISRHHARITCRDAEWLIKDLGSKNGIRINTYKAAQQRLHDGDRIDLGAVRLYVQIRSQERGARAKVVFKDEKERGTRTEIIEMDHLGSLLGSQQGPKPAPQPSSADSKSLTPEPASLLQLFSEAAESLLSCETLEDTLERILGLVFNNLPAERGVICLYDEASDTSEAKVTRTAEGVTDERIAISTHIVNDVIKRKQALLVQDTKMDERFGGAESVIMMRIRSAMCAPLYHDGCVIGFIYVDRQSGKHPFRAPHLQALSALAALSAVAVNQAALRDDIRREQEIRGRLARYSSPAVVNRIIQAAGGSEAGMVAEEGDVTVLFGDLTGFTAMAESMHSSDVVQLLNQVFERLTEAIFEYEGTLDKFRGDGMMAFFGAPLAQPDHAQRAVDAALRMQQILADMNTYAGWRRIVAMRIGINSGSVVVGDIGSPQRKDYTVIGDVVNTASRLESSVARPGQVVIGPETYARIRGEFLCEELPEAALKGKRKGVRPYCVLERLDT